MSRLKPTTTTDIEQPPPPPPQLFRQMPRLTDPKLIQSMTQSITEISATRSVLQTLGDRPTHEAVDTIRSKLARLESNLSKQLEQIVLAPRPDNVDRLQWRSLQSEKEKECRQAAENEKRAYKAVLQLDEMHEAHEKQLKDAEARLVKIYDDSLLKDDKGDDDGVVPPDVKEEVNEEVVGLLQEASMKGFDRVELSGRKLRFLPEAFGKLTGLVLLNLSNNQLEVIPDSIAGLENLQELKLSSNLLDSLPDSIGMLLNLKIFDVSSNKLKALPDSISNCRSLVELDASFNNLTYLPTNIGYELVNLQKLSVQLNKIRSLPTSICEMRSLRHMDVHFNELRGLPYAIGKLANLEALILSSNFSDLTELPDALGELTNLRELDLSNNQIHALPDTFGRLDNLTKLNLDENPLVIPPMEIVNKGVEAVKEYMAKRWLDVLIEEEQKCMLEANQAQTGWLTRSTSWLNNWVSVVSQNVTGYAGAGGSPRAPCLDQQY